MSGICGFTLGPGSRPEILSLQQARDMARAMETRPGCPLHTVAAPGVAFGAAGFGRRLTGVAEQTVGEQERILLVFHGSLFGPLEGLVGGSASGDPAGALLRAYCREGLAFLPRVRGEFALAIWDGRENVLHLASDPFRVVPIFYAVQDGAVYFASRMKGLMVSPRALRLTVSRRAVVELVGSSFIPTPRTIFEEVTKLPPGHTLRFQDGRVSIAPYWDIDFLHPDGAREPELASRLRELLSDSVRVRIAADGNPDRIGSFLSGGVDSSTVSGLLREISGRPIRSFSIGFGESRYNEISYARLAARALGVDYQEYFVTPADVLSILPDLIESFDEPFGNASAVPTYYCARLAHDHGVDALYAGDGGDELFAGNERYATDRIFDHYRRLPTWLHEAVLRPIVYGAAERVPLSLLQRAKKYIERASIPYPQFLTSYGFYRTVPPHTLFDGEVLAALGADFDPGEAVHRLFEQAPAKTILDRHLYVDLKAAICDNDLFKVTRMTECAGVTVRYPFLDAPLVAFAATIPARLKMRGGELRTFFKGAYEHLLPRAVLTKKKHGFGLPIAIWLRTDRELHDLMRDFVLGERSLARGYFRRGALEDLVRLHAQDTTAFYGTVLWNLMILELWHRRYRATSASS